MYTHWTNKTREMLSQHHSLCNITHCVDITSKKHRQKCLREHHLHAVPRLNLHSNNAAGIMHRVCNKPGDMLVRTLFWLTVFSYCVSSVSGVGPRGRDNVRGRDKTRPRKCEEITIPMCRGIGYNHTYMPNQFHHETQEEAGLEVCQSNITVCPSFVSYNLGHTTWKENVSY